MSAYSFAVDRCSTDFADSDLNRFRFDSQIPRCFILSNNINPVLSYSASKVGPRAGGISGFLSEI